MMKLLIVDDEQIERDGIEAILKDNFSMLEIKQAKNGKSALQVASSFKPDLVLMDNKMPGISGLEAIEKMNKLHPNCKFIMITAYAKFDYAQLAIRLGVIDYLLKPTKASEIVQTVGKVLRMIEDERKLLEKKQYQQSALQKALPIIEADVVTQLLFDHVHDIQLEELVELLDIQMVKEQFVMSIFIPKGLECVYAAIKQKINETTSAWIGALYGRQVPIIVFRDVKKSFRLQAITLARVILSLAKMQDQEKWFIGIGNVYHSMDGMKQSYQESVIATKDTTLPVKFRFYADLPVIDTGKDSYRSKQLEKQLFDYIRNGQKQDVYTNVMDSIQFFQHEQEDLNQAQQRVLELLWIASRALDELGVDHETPFFPFQVLDFRQLRSETEHLLNKLWKSYEDHYKSVEDDTIQQIKQYIMAHSHQNISLNQIGQQVGLSPIYISKIFKEKFGVNYVHFLTDCRIEMAKKLMVDPKKSFKEITFEVGYQDPNYFSKVFRKISGISPTEYRKTMLGMKR